MCIYSNFLSCHTWPMKTKISSVLFIMIPLSFLLGNLLSNNRALMFFTSALHVDEYCTLISTLKSQFPTNVKLHSTQFNYHYKLKYYCE